MKKMLLIALVLLFMPFALAYFEEVYPGEIEKGKSNELVVVIYNNQNYKLDDATMSLYMPDFAFRWSEKISVKSKKYQKAYFEIDVPNEVKPGYYPAILTINSDDSDKDIRQKRHAWIYVR